MNPKQVHTTDTDPVKKIFHTNRSYWYNTISLKLI